MKLIVQIPCYNEEKTIASVLSSIPKKIKGIDEIEILVISDGCTDRTAQIASDFDVKHILEFRKNRGLARTFMSGIDYCLKNNADVIVNIDGDNQYAAEDIPNLLAPILDGSADISIGDRNLLSTQYMTKTKKILQILGSSLMSFITFRRIKDATSGFRAYSKWAAINLEVRNNFTYTLETIIRMSHKKFKIKFIPTGTNKTLRSSRLFKSNFEYIRKSTVIVARTFFSIHYKIILAFLLIICYLLTKTFIFKLLVV